MEFDTDIDRELSQALRYDDSELLLKWLRCYRLAGIVRRGDPTEGENPPPTPEVGRAPDVPRHVCKHIRCITLTTDVDEPKALWVAVGKIVRSSMFDVRYYYAALELTERGLPHIHLLVYANCKYFDVSKLKSFWKKRFECVKPFDKIGEDYYKYLFKEINSPIIIEYCERNGVPQTKSHG